jgi:hypothetical protein
MCPRVVLRSSLRIVLVLLIGIALLPAPFVSLLVSAMGQGQSERRPSPPPRIYHKAAMKDPGHISWGYYWNYGLSKKCF